MQSARRRTASGLPVNTNPPVLVGDVLIGESFAITPGTWTGSPSLTYSLLRDGAPIIGLVDVSKETIEAYEFLALDIGPQLILRESDSVSSTYADSDPVIYDDATHLPNTAIGVSTQGITPADGDTTVQAWAAALGGISCTLVADAATNRPAYSATGGAGSRPLVAFDGVDNVLKGAITKGAAFATYELGIVAKQLASGAAGDIAIGYYVPLTMVFSVQEQTGGKYRMTVVGGANVSTTTDPQTAMIHASGDAASGTINARINGTVEGTSSGTVTSRADGNTLCLGGNFSNAAASQFECQAWHCGPSLTADQRTHLRALLTYHTGVSA